MTKPILIIANPVSGAGRGETLARGLAEALAGHGLRAEIRLTQVDRSGTEIAREIEPGSVRAIAVVGGDGSVNDVICGLRDLSIPIALLPAGTANVWACEARLRRDPQATARIIAAGRHVEAALGEANGAPFFLFAGAGFDARLVHRVEKIRARRGHRGGMRQWLRPGCAEFFRAQADLTVTVEGERIEGLAMALVTRVAKYAGVMTMPADIDIADGVMHVLGIARCSKLRLAGIAARALLGQLRNGRDLVHVATEKPVRIESAGGAEPYHRDGDHAGELPVEVSLSGRVVRLLVV